MLNRAAAAQGYRELPRQILVIHVSCEAKRHMERFKENREKQGKFCLINGSIPEHKRSHRECQALCMKSEWSTTGF